MANRVLLLGVELCHAAAAQLGNLEQRVVAKTIGALAVIGNRALHVAVAADDLLAILVARDQDDRGVEARRALALAFVKAIFPRSACIFFPSTVTANSFSLLSSS